MATATRLSRLLNKSLIDIFWVEDMHGHVSFEERQNFFEPSCQLLKFQLSLHHNKISNSKNYHSIKNIYCGITIQKISIQRKDFI